MNPPSRFTRYPLCTVALLSVGLWVTAAPTQAAPESIALQFDTASEIPSEEPPPASSTVDMALEDPAPPLETARVDSAPDSAAASEINPAPLKIPTGASAAPVGAGGSLAELPPPPEPVIPAALTAVPSVAVPSTEAVAPTPIAPALPDPVAVVPPGEGISFDLPGAIALASPPPSTVATQPQSPPEPSAAPSAGAEALPEALAAIFQGGVNSLVAIAVGHAEGTRTATGEKTRAYGGHTDPGNGVWNLGTFSYQHGAASPAEADTRQLQRLGQQATIIIQAAQQRDIRLSLEAQLNAIDLANQSPAAALSAGGYLDRLQEAYQMGLHDQDAILWARTRSYLDPDTRQWNAPGLGNTVEGITADQDRRMQAIARVLQTQTPAPTTPETDGGAIADALFSIDLPR